MKISVRIQLTPRQCTWLIVLSLLLNLFVLLGTALSNQLAHVPKGPDGKFILNQLNLGIENVLAAWYSSMLLLAVALAALLCFFIDHQQKKGFLAGILNAGWLFFSLIFLTLSLDEMGSFHESIGETALFRSVGFGQGWNAFFFLIFLVALFMLSFFITKVKTSKRSFVFMLLGTLLFLSNPFQEAFEVSTYRNATEASNWGRPIALLLLEEGSELFGALCFLTALIVYALDRSRQLHLTQNAIHLQVPVSSSRLARYIALLLLLGFALLALLYSNGNRMPKADDGIAENWSPSAVFFVAALMAGYKIIGRNSQRGKTGYGLLALLALLYSAYFGSNLHESELVHQPLFSGLSLYHLLLLASVCVAGVVLFSFNRKESRLLVLGYMLLTLLLFFSLPMPVQFIGYLSAALLLGAITVQYVSEPEAAPVAETTQAGIDAKQPL